MDGSGLDWRGQLQREGYFGPAAPALAVYEAVAGAGTVLVSGPRGCGKSTLVRAVASALRLRIVPLECTADLPPEAAVYRWDTARQLAAVQAGLDAGRERSEIESEIATEDFVDPGPLLEAIHASDAGEPVVVVVDALERANAGLRALLGRVLESYEVDVPSLGRFGTRGPLPIVFLSRGEPASPGELAGRCRVVPMGYPAFDEELALIAHAVPALSPEVAVYVCNLARRLRVPELRRPPGLGETIQLARRLTAMGRVRASGHALATATETLVTHPADRAKVFTGGVERLLGPALDRAV